MSGPISLARLGMIVAFLCAALTALSPHHPIFNPTTTTTNTNTITTTTLHHHLMNLLVNNLPPPLLPLPPGAFAQVFTTETNMCDAVPSMIHHPSWSIGVSSPSPSASCRDVVLASVFLPDGGSDWAIEAALRSAGIPHHHQTTPSPSSPTSTTNPNPNADAFSYSMSRTAVITVTKKNSRITYPLSWSIDEQNAYEGVVLLSTGSRCESLPSSNFGDNVCCQTTPTVMTVVGLVHNASTIRCSAVEGGRSRFDVEVSVRFTDTQNSTSTQWENITLSESLWSVAGHTLNATITNQFVFGGAIRDFAGFYVCNDLGRPHEEPFFVPTWAFGAQPNKIGMSKWSFQSAFECSANRGSTTNVVDENPHDQFSAFRDNTIGRMISGISGGAECAFESISDSLLTTRCSQYGSSSVLLELAADEVKLVKLFAVTYPLSLSFSWAPTSSSSSTSSVVLFFLDINNRNQYFGTVQIDATSCCVVREVCSSHLRYVNESGGGGASAPTCGADATLPHSSNNGGSLLGALHTMRHTILINAASQVESATATNDEQDGWCRTSLYVGSAMCDVAIRQHGVVVQQFRVIGPLLQNAPPARDPPQDGTPSSGEGDSCAASPRDVQLDPSTGACIGLSAADCVLKYPQATPPKTFYNEARQLCEPVVTCLTHELFDLERNTCIDPLSEPLPGEGGIGDGNGNFTGAPGTGGGGGVGGTPSPDGLPPGPGSSDAPPPLTTDEPANCGPNGNWNTTLLDCDCDEGYSTSVNQDPLNRSSWEFCTSRSSQQPANTASQSANISWGLLQFLERLTSGGWTFIVLVVASFILLLAACFFKQSKHNKRKKKSSSKKYPNVSQRKRLPDELRRRKEKSRRRREEKDCV